MVEDVVIMEVEKSGIHRQSGERRNYRCDGQRGNKGGGGEEGWAVDELAVGEGCSPKMSSKAMGIDTKLEERDGTLYYCIESVTEMVQYMTSPQLLPSL